MRYPLEGVKILDFTHLLPGPYATMMLADLGADIIKVENLTNPDMMRIMPPTVNGVSAAYAHINRGKKSVAIDLKKKGAAEVVHRLLREYDIIVEQFRPGVMEKLGLGYDALRKVQPMLIYCSLTGYGQSGSYSDRAGHDINYLALSGMASYSGRKSGGPSLMGIQIADICAGSKNLVIALLAAFIKRQSTGEGDYIDISMTDSSFALTAFQAANFLASGVSPERESDMLNGGSVYDYYKTSDGQYLSVGGLEAKFARSFYGTLGLGDLSSLVFATSEETAAVKNKVAEAIASRPLDHWLKVFGEVDACVEPVRTMAEAVSRPPLSERGMVVEVKDDTGTSLKQVGNPIKFRSGNYVAPAAGVGLGRDNGEILKSLGYSEDQIRTLRENGVIN